MPVMPAALMGGRYRPEEQLAVGGMGEIWRGEDTVLQRPIAIKMLRADHASDVKFRERFRAEARHAAGLTHPNVTQVFDFVDDETDSPPYIVMEYVAGESLAAILQREAPLGAERTWGILGQTAAALGAAHRLGIVHRDVKPGNILVCPDGRVKVTDFGIARAFGEASVTNPGLVLGTAQYLAPEQLNGAQATPASDMYALGVVGFQCLTGRPLFHGDTREVLQAHRAAVLPSLPADVPTGLGDLVRALLARNPADRPDDAEAIAAQARRMARGHAQHSLREQSDAAQGVAAADAYPAEPTQAAAPSLTDDPATRQMRTPRRSWRDVPRSAAVAAAVLVILVVGTTLLATSILTTGPSRHGSSGSGAPASIAAKPVAASGASLFGGSDHPEELHYVTDSSSSTAWYTEHYATAEFGGLKSGVGLRVHSSSSAPVKTVLIRFADPGVAARLYAGDNASPGTQAVAATSSAPVEWRVSLPRPVADQSWLIWITRLVPDSGGYRAGVADVRFLT